jgi:hypothetical protein
MHPMEELLADEGPGHADELFQLLSSCIQVE